ncbi:hypothetical protein [Flavobacterium sp.]|jgi:hypothetical protein|uniref:hypothetical protein n=1 Tax=Flavobacterium sp. TaxID=239 RepID=UPI0037BE9D05
MTVNTVSIGPGSLTIGSDLLLTNFSSQVLSGKIVPNITKGDPINALSGDTASGDREETFTLVVKLQADFGLTGSRDEWLWEHRGEEHDFVFIPNSSVGRRITGVLTVEPIEIGGDVKTKPSHEVTFDLSGAPVFDTVA